MSRLKALSKSTWVYWLARKRHAKRKYASVIGALRQFDDAPTETLANRTVMIFSSVGIFGDHVMVDALLARALERRGAKVLIALCDAQMKACHASDRYSYAFTGSAAARERRQQRLCASCVDSTRTLVKASGLTYVFFSEGIAHDDMLGKAGEVDLSDEINSGVVRFAASSHPSVLDRLPPDIRRSYTHGATAAHRAIEGLIRKYQPETLIAHHGIYVPQGVVQKVAKVRKLDFYSWHFGYRKSTLIFSRGDTYHRELTAPQPSAFEAPLAPPQRERILKYLQSRMTGVQDWIHFNRKPKASAAAALPRGYFVLYTSVDWDAALHFPASVFSSQFEFLDRVIEIFRRTPEHDLVIRVHPAEVTGFHPAALSVDDHLRDTQLPSNVRIVSAKDTTSSYDLASRCMASIVYNTKLGIELPPFGIPVIVAGDCWIRGKGFSYDVDELGDLERFIRTGTELRVDEEQRERALQFAYYFYFRRCIDTPELTSAGSKFQVAIDVGAMERSSSTGSGLSFIADRILAHDHVQLAA